MQVPKNTPSVTAASHRISPQVNATDWKRMQSSVYRETIRPFPSSLEPQGLPSSINHALSSLIMSDKYSQEVKFFRMSSTCSSCDGNIYMIIRWYAFFFFLVVTVKQWIKSEMYLVMFTINLLAVGSFLLSDYITDSHHAVSDASRRW